MSLAEALVNEPSVPLVDGDYDFSPHIVQATPNDPVFLLRRRPKGAPADARWEPVPVEHFEMEPLVTLRNSYDMKGVGRTPVNDREHTALLGGLSLI